MIDTVQIGGFDFEVRRSGRRQTLGLTVDRTGALIAHAPIEVSTDELSHWIQKKLLWVHRKLAVKQETTRQMRAPE